jgi:16S rRNA (uracil1498-N3)-methyltransferase
VTSERLAGSAGPHVFVESLDEMVVADEDLSHLTKSLRMRVGNPLTAGDGNGSWRRAALAESGTLEPVGDVVFVDPRERPVSVAFSLVKGQRPELAIRKLTELGVDRIVLLSAERSVVKWDDAKVRSAKDRWRRIAREASMQSHRARLPELDALTPAVEWISRSDAAIAQFGGRHLGTCDTSIAVGPEGGWSVAELAAAAHAVSLGDTVLRAETAAIAAGTLLTAVGRGRRSDVR